LEPLHKPSFEKAAFRCITHELAQCGQSVRSLRLRQSRLLGECSTNGGFWNAANDCSEPRVTDAAAHILGVSKAPIHFGKIRTKSLLTEYYKRYSGRIKEFVAYCFLF
jgi:hypothetical protein